MMRALAFGALVVATMVARLVLLETGPEIDPDAYAHAMAGRRVLEGTQGVELHWVWLPLWHWLHALALRFGNGIDTMRALNVGVSAIAPVLLVSLLKMPGALPWIAGAVLALSPTLLVHGASSQLEPPVLTLTLAACLAWERCSKQWLIGILGGLALAAAVLIRYEAWAVVLALSFLWTRERSLERAPIWLLPIGAIAAWCVHHRLAAGQWFQFLSYNADFAHGYLAGVGYPWGSEPNALLALLWYVVAVPWIEHAVIAPLALLGVAWFVRAAPRSLAVAQLCMLAFLAIGFAAGQHLGLARHGLVIAPLYATCVAAGVVRAQELARPKLVLAVSLVALLSVRSVPRYLQGLERHRTAYRAELTTAQALRHIVGERDWVFCDRAPVEVLSNLPPARFTRWPVRDVRPFQLERAAGPCGRAIIVSDAENTVHLRAVTEPIYENGSLLVLAYQPVTTTLCARSTRR